jgi:hypothetical protein
MAYIGQSLTEGKRRVYTYVATAGQTTFNAVYDVNAVDVYQNGILLSPSDYTATNGTTVVFTVAALLDDEVTISCHNTYSVGDSVSADAGGTFGGNVTFGQDVQVQGAFTSKGIDDNAASTAMTLDGSGNLLVGTTNVNPAASNVTGHAIKAGGLAEHSNSGAVVMRLNRTDSDGDITEFYRGTSTVGSISVDSSGTTYKTEDGTSGKLANSVSDDSFIFSRKSIGSGQTITDYNSNSFSNSIFVANHNTMANKPPVDNNGVGMYLSTYGLTGSGNLYNTASDERAAQVYYPDSDEESMYYRVKQGTSGWHAWRKTSNDYAFKEGPLAFSSAFKNTWNLGYDYGSSFDATSSNAGITINETGNYLVEGWARASSATDVYIGLAVNGNRLTIENRSEGVWGHDHVSSSNSWGHTKYMGKLVANEIITMGPPTSSYVPNLYYGGTQTGWAASYYIVRIS